MQFVIGSTSKDLVFYDTQSMVSSMTIMNFYRPHQIILLPYVKLSIGSTSYTFAVTGPLACSHVYHFTYIAKNSSLFIKSFITKPKVYMFNSNCRKSILRRTPRTVIYLVWTTLLLHFAFSSIPFPDLHHVVVVFGR